MPTTHKKARAAENLATPGYNVRRLREAAGLTLRGLADKCVPALDHTTISRIEDNNGYTQDTLQRIAKALGVSEADLFLPPEIAAYRSLDDRAQARILDMIRDAAEAQEYRTRRR